MTIAGQIEALIQRLDGVAICDDCVTDRLNLSVRSQANVVTRGLGGANGFRREKAAVRSLQFDQGFDIASAPRLNSLITFRQKRAPPPAAP